MKIAALALAFVQFASVPPAVKDSLRFEAPIGDFEARDTNGRLWRKLDLAGTFTVVEIWFTNCGPCRQEHPELQRFHEKVRGGKRIQLVTISLDEQPEVTREYMKAMGYTFPVIQRASLERKLFPTDGAMPAHWVIDPLGRGLRRSGSGASDGF